MTGSTLREIRTTPILRRTIIRRFDSTWFAIVSPIERWSDDNYAPQPLDFAWNTTPESFEIVTCLHGFDPHEVHVDLCRGQVIILLSHAYDAASIVQQEYYREIPIPAAARRDAALVEIGSDFLTVTLRKRKSNLFKRAASEFTRLEKGAAVLWGKDRVEQKNLKSWIRLKRHSSP